MPAPLLTASLSTPARCPQVVSVVLPLKWVRQPGRWVAITMTVGDSAAYVYRAASRRVEEVTAAAHADGARCGGRLWRAGHEAVK